MACLVAVNAISILLAAVGQPAGGFPGQEGDFLIRVHKNLIYRLTLDGTEERIHPQDGLTKRDGREPVWSPTGHRIAFVRQIDRKMDIYVMDPDGTDVRRVTDHPSEEFSPAWSPDGEHIVFVSDRSGKNQLYTKRIGADRARRVFTNLSVSDPTWSPNGDRIAFVGGMKERDPRDDAIYTINIDGTDLRTISDFKSQEAQPAWSPDGSRIAYSAMEPTFLTAERLMVKDANGLGAATELQFSKCRLECYGFDIVWSPDGRRVAVALFSEYEQAWELRTITLDGKEEETIYSYYSISSIDWEAVQPGDRSRDREESTFSPGLLSFWRT